MFGSFIVYKSVLEVKVTQKCLAEFKDVGEEYPSPLQFFSSGVTNHLNMLVKDLLSSNVVVEQSEVLANSSFESRKKEFS